MLAFTYAIKRRENNIGCYIYHGLRNVPHRVFEVPVYLVPHMGCRSDNFE
jgi:hypothetical protein